MSFLSIAVYTPEQLAEKYSNITFLFYCVILVLVVALHHSIYRCDLEADWFVIFLCLLFVYLIYNHEAGEENFCMLFLHTTLNHTGICYFHFPMPLFLVL